MTKISLEDRVLFYNATKAHHSDESGRGLQVASPLEFNEFLNNIELKTKLTYEIISPQTLKPVTVPQNFFYSSENGIILVTVNVGGWAKPFYSVDMIATRENSGRMLLGIARELREAYLAAPVKLPLLIDTVNPIITKRVFDTRVDEDTKDITYFKIRDVIIAYASNSQLPEENDIDFETQTELELLAKQRKDL